MSLPWDEPLISLSNKYKSGALDPVRFANPLKRTRPSNTVVTRYQTAPQNQAHVSPQGYGSARSPQGQAGYSQYQTGQSPATPTSAQSPSQQQYIQQQWQQYYQYQQAYQQGNHNQPGFHYQQPQYQSPSIPAGEFANGSQQANQASPQIPQNGCTPQIYQAQYPQTPLPQPATTFSGPYQHAQQHSQNSIDPGSFIHKQRNGSLIEPISSPRGTRQDDSADAEADEDDLNLLDIPSVPPSPREAGVSTCLPNTLVSPPVNLLCMPLPANFVVADTLYPIAPPLPEMKGRCQSKYFRDNNLELLKENIRESRYWKDHKDDPVFSDSSMKEGVVSLDELFSKIKERHVSGDLSEDPVRKSRSLSRSVSVRQNSGDFRGDLETLERDLAKLKAEMGRKERLARSKHSSPPQSATSERPMVEKVVIKEEEVPPQSAFSEKAPLSAQETEDVLASLGVTGPPKPIMRPLRTSHHGSPDDNIRSLSRSSSKAEISHLSKDHLTNGSPQYPQGYAPPPPPPPPYRQQSFVEGANGSPLSAPPLYTNSYSYNAKPGEYGNGSSEYGPDAQFTSPTEFRSERSGSRKRSYTRRDSISDEETPSRRQEDDSTPKHKRRAPKVQEAYG